MIPQYRIIFGQVASQMYHNKQTTILQNENGVVLIISFKVWTEYWQISLSLKFIWELKWSKLQKLIENKSIVRTSHIVQSLKLTDKTRFHVLIHYPDRMWVNIFHLKTFQTLVFEVFFISVANSVGNCQFVRLEYRLT